MQKEEEVATLQHKFSQDIRIKDVKYVSREEALSIYKSNQRQSPLGGLSALQVSLRLWNFLLPTCHLLRNHR